MDLRERKRRRAQRIDGEGFVSFNGIEGGIVNVSASGLAIKSQSNLGAYIDERLTFKIEFDPEADPEDSVSFEAHGTIRYSRGPDKNLQYFAGVQFEDMNPEQQMEFEKFLVLLWESQLG